MLVNSTKITYNLHNLLLGQRRLLIIPSKILTVHKTLKKNQLILSLKEFDFRGKRRSIPWMIWVFIRPVALDGPVKLPHM